MKKAMSLYTFNLSGFPDSARLCTLTRMKILTNSYYNITYCQIRTPNGQTYLAPYGKVWGPENPEIYDYLDSPDNVPMNGKWTVTIESSKTLSDLQFSLSGSYKMIVGNDVN